MYDVKINLKKFDSPKIFDDSFFLYFEEFDLCNRDFRRNVYMAKIYLLMI